MARLFHKKRAKGETFDTDIMHVLNLTPMMDILIVLVVFLLITAVFTSITIMELSVPTNAGGSALKMPNFTVEVIVRKLGLEIGNGNSVEAAIPKKGDRYDMDMLSKILVRLKALYPEKKDATILMEPDIDYDNLIDIMDTVRGAEIKEDGSAGTRKVVLFPNISIGDAP